MGEVATSISVMTGLGLTFGSILALAYRFLRVEEDPRLEVVEELLPGNNCGACGQPGCAAFAEKVVEGELSPGKCTVADADTLDDLASLLGVDVGAEEKRIARLKCAGGLSNVRNLAHYQGMESCRAAAVVDVQAATRELNSNKTINRNMGPPNRQEFANLRTPFCGSKKRLDSRRFSSPPSWD